MQEDMPPSRAPQPKLSVRDRIRRSIEVEVADAQTILHLEHCISLHLGLKVRRSKVIRSASSILRSYAKVTWIEDSKVLIPLQLANDRIGKLIDELATGMTPIAKQPLTIRELLTILPISNKERLRWTKRGRLPRGGAATITRGQLISIPSYSVAEIEALLATPDIIEEWREADRLDLAFPAPVQGRQ